MTCGSGACPQSHTRLLYNWAHYLLVFGTKGATTAPLDDIRKMAEAALDGQLQDITADDLAAGAELVAEEAANTADRIAAKVASLTPEDVAAGAELVSEQVASQVEKISADIAKVTPEDLEAGAELVSEAVENALNNATAE